MLLPADSVEFDSFCIKISMLLVILLIQSTFLKDTVCVMFICTV